MNVKKIIFSFGYVSPIRTASKSSPTYTHNISIVFPQKYTQKTKNLHKKPVTLIAPKLPKMF